MTKIVVMVVSDKEAKLIEDTLNAAAPHMADAKKRESQTLARKIKNETRRVVN